MLVKGATCRWDNLLNEFCEGMMAVGVRPSADTRYTSIEKNLMKLALLQFSQNKNPMETKTQVHNLRKLWSTLMNPMRKTQLALGFSLLGRQIDCGRNTLKVDWNLQWTWCKICMVLTIRNKLQWNWIQIRRSGKQWDVYHEYLEENW